MGIIVHEAQKSFHLYNGEISYILAVLPDGSMGQLYCGKRIHDREDYSYFLEGCIRSHSAVIEPFLFHSTTCLGGLSRTR